MLGITERGEGGWRNSREARRSEAESARARRRRGRPDQAGAAGRGAEPGFSLSVVQVT